MGLNIHVNTGTVDDVLGVGEFVLLDPDVDKLILLTNGSTAVADGQVIPSTTQLNNAGIVLAGIQQVCTKYFLVDDSANLLKLIHNMGADNKRYVLCFEFTAETASVPVLELWDDTDMDTADYVCLGAGTPANSWIRGVTTTTSLPGAGWVGSKLGGASAGNYLELDTVPLTGAKNLYCKICVTVPSTQVNGGAETPLMVIKYCSV
jgi:hypothetical protein